MTHIKNDEKEYWFRRYPRMAITILLVFLFVVILFFVELILGFKIEDHWGKDLIRNERSINLVEYSPMINTTIFPTDEYCKDVDAKNLVQQNYKFRTDSNGYIMPSKIHSDPDLTIAFLGGSTTECLFVQEENRFPNLSVRLIEKQIHQKINSLNAGVSGMGSMNATNILVNKLLPEKPDYVILMSNINDFSILLYTGAYWNTSNRTLIKEKEQISFLKASKEIAEAIVPNTYTSIKNLVAPQNTDEWAKYRNKSKRLDSEKICESYKRSLTAFVTICKNWNIKPVLMTQAHRFPAERPKSAQFKLTGINYLDFITTYSRMNDIIREIASENNVLLIDLEKKIPKDTLHIYDMVHLNDTGSILASKTIADVLGSYLEESTKKDSVE